MGDGIFADIGAIERRLGLPDGFYTRLLKEDDWSFVIKTSAFLEATCSHILVKRLGAPELAEAFGYLDHGNLKYGKVALLKALGAITSAQAGVLQRVASLRNELVHDISNVAFSFAAYVQGLGANDRKGLVKHFGHGVADEVPAIGGGALQDREVFVLANPKHALWLTTAEIVACLYLEGEASEVKILMATLRPYSPLGGGFKSTLKLPRA